MSRRTVAGLLAIGLITVLGFVALSRPVPWVRYQPGPTFDVLDKYDGKEIIKVTGHKTYSDGGALRMVTVRPDGPEDEVDLISVLFAWADPDISVYPKSIYKKAETNESVREESAAQMTSSQDASIAAALAALDIGFSTEVAIPISEVDTDGASNGRLKVGDRLVAVGGKSAKTASEFVKLVRSTTPGSVLRLTVLREGTRKNVSVTTRADEKNPRESRINITFGGSPEIKLVLPFEVEYQLDERIGGSSAGMIFALALYDRLTPGSLTGGKSVAGTGEISPDGVVGPIGGIGQKLAGAQRDGARLFLAPEENCAEAARAHYDHDKLRVVKIHTLKDAIKAVEAWRKNPDADLPRCTR